jgi:hypothetical protein
LLIFEKEDLPTINNCSLAYLALGDVENSKKYLLKGVEIFRKSCSPKSFVWNFLKKNLFNIELVSQGQFQCIRPAFILEKLVEFSIHPLLKRSFNVNIMKLRGRKK